jgi:Sec-independent protein translocase protein TatA
VGFGTEILFMIALGGLLLGPKRLHAVLGNVARAKAQFEEASRNLKSQLEAELEARHGDNKTDPSQELDRSH